MGNNSPICPIYQGVEVASVKERHKLAISNRIHHGLVLSLVRESGPT